VSPIGSISTSNDGMSETQFRLTLTVEVTAHALGIS